jgi:hypothetical protein
MPHDNGCFTDPAGCGRVSAGNSRPASHADTAVMSDALSWLATIDMQYGATVARVCVRQEPNCELM